jgi:hypothetical protein
MPIILAEEHHAKWLGKIDNGDEGVAEAIILPKK